MTYSLTQDDIARALNANPEGAHRNSLLHEAFKRFEGQAISDGEETIGVRRIILGYPFIEVRLSPSLHRLGETLFYGMCCMDGKNYSLNAATPRLPGSIGQYFEEIGRYLTIDAIVDAVAHKLSEM